MIKSYSSVIVKDLSNDLINDINVLYYLSTSSTELIGGSWSKNPPTWEDGKYYWQKTITIFNDDTSNETAPVCITGGTGNTGATGRSVVSITPEYYLSTSKIEQIGSSWSETQPNWSSGHYVWTRSKIIYSNPSSIEYTFPICDTTWEAMQSQINTITKTMSGVSSKVDSVEKAITSKTWQSDIAESINNYDETSIKTIRDTVAENKISIGNITNKVSDVETIVLEKADGSTVQTLSEKVSTMEQDANGFKQIVEENYLAKNDLNLSSRNLLRNSKTLLFDSYGLGSMYLTDEFGTILTDENDNFILSKWR